MRPAKNRSIAFLINGNAQSAAAFRGRAFAGYLSEEYDIDMAYRARNKGLAILRFIKLLLATRPGITYVVDMAYSGVIAGILYRVFSRNRLIIDTGDSVFALAQSLGRRKFGLFLTWLLEACSLRTADQVIVRGTTHKHQLCSKGIPVEVIQDGVEGTLFRPMDVAELRRTLGLQNVITVGVLGSLTWNRKLQMCYGAELIDAMSLLRDLPVKGVIIGDGSGLSMLKNRAREMGVDDRVLFFGRVPYQHLPQYLNLIDICLSTQTNDSVGQVRTTGKLPLYLASGKFILASRVGEAALLLPDSMLVDYENTNDVQYAQKLAGKIRNFCDHPQVLTAEKVSRSLAMKHFDYSVLSRRLSMVLTSVVRPA